MNWVDFLIIFIILLFAIEGTRRGFFVQLFDIVGFFVSLVASLIFYPQAALVFINFFNLPKIAANPVGFLVVWVITESIFAIFFGVFLKKFLASFSITSINKYLGFIPAIINSLLFLSFALLFVVSLPIRPDIKRDIFASKTGANLIEKASFFERPLSSIFGPIAKQSLTFLTVNPKESGSIKLGYTQEQHAIDFEGEKRMFDMVNSERIKFGVVPLVWDDELAVVARRYSQDMFEQGYFSHYSPEGEDVGDRLDNSGIPYSAAGENLALAPDVSRAHTGLMNSEGHRRNILDVTYRKMGIGAVDGGVYGLMFTQIFTD